MYKTLTQNGVLYVQTVFKVDEKKEKNIELNKKQF